MNGPGFDVGNLFGLLLAGMFMFFWLLVLVVMAWLLPAWLRSYLGGAPVMVLQLLAMRLRGVPPGLIVDALVTLAQRGHPHDPSRVRLAESIYLARRGQIDSAAELAERVEEEMKRAKK